MRVVSPNARRKWDNTPHRRILGKSYCLPPEVVTWVGFEDGEVLWSVTEGAADVVCGKILLTKMNDSGKPFPEIARAIKEHL